MTEIEILREEVKAHIERADEKSLRRVQAILQIDEEDDFWDTLHDDVKADVEIAIAESKRGEGVPHEEVMKKYGNR